MEHNLYFSDINSSYMYIVQHSIIHHQGLYKKAEM